MKHLCLTLDLDGPAEYAALHGADATGADADVMYGAPLERFAELCGTVGARGTVFAIGRDVQGDNARRLRRLAEQGFEIGSHSMSHDYGLCRRAVAVIRAEVQESRDRLTEAVGRAPMGFRAPGHNLSAALLDALEAAGYFYDSSVLPSPPYYVLKSLVLGAYRALGRASAAELGSPRQPLAPRQPYRPGNDPYDPGGRRLLEIPIAVATPLGLPLTGAALALAPAPLRRALAGSLAADEVIVLNFHGIDLLDAEALPEGLAARQPELRRPYSARRAIFAAAVGELGRGRTLSTLAALAHARL